MSNFIGMTKRAIRSYPASSASINLLMDGIACHGHGVIPALSDERFQDFFFLVAVHTLPPPAASVVKETRPTHPACKPAHPDDGRHG